MKYLVFVVIIVFSVSNATAQEPWSLTQCVKYAIEHNLQVKQSALTTQINNENVKQAKGSMLPNVTGFATHAYNYGRRIDPFTNRFANKRVRSNNFALSTSVNIFNGFQIQNTIKKSKIDLEKSRYDLEKLKNDISLSVASGYLQILFNEELLGIAINQSKVTEKQIKRIGKLVVAGTSPKGDLLNLESQLAQEELQVVNTQNQLDISYLNLKQLLELDSVNNFKIEKPVFDFTLPSTITSTSTQIYKAAITIRPEVKSSELQILSSEKSLAISRGKYYPTLSFSGSYGTGFSGLSRQVIATNSLGLQPIGVTSTGEPVLVEQFKNTFQNIPFKNQFRDNINKSISFSLNVPLFNRFATRTSVNQSVINIEQARLNLELTKNQLEKDIEKAYTDALAALKKHNATKKAVNANEQAYIYAEKRFNAGVIESVAYYDTKNKLTKSKSDLIQAKYDFIFKTKILDFYQGKSLAF